MSDHEPVWSDENTEWYVANYGEHFSNALTILHAGFTKDDHLLDIGCGSGPACREAAKIIINGSIIGIDPTPAMIRFANEQTNNSSIQFIEGSAEILFPLPFVKDRRSLKSVLFVDAGNVFNTNCPQVSTFCKDFDYRALRYSAGIAVTWITGFAPISFSLSELNKL